MRLCISVTNMKITIENTTKIVEVSGVPARIWEGHTDSGIAVRCFVTRIAVHKSQDCSQFERELQETRPPSAALEGISLRLVI